MLKAMVATCLLALSTALCQAAPIVGVTGTSNTGDFDTASGFSTLNETLDFTNISGNDLTDITTNGFGWFSDGSAGYPVINTYDLGGVYSLARFGFWNASAPDSTPLAAFGLQDVVIEWSLDNVTYNPLTGAGFSLIGLYTFAQSSDGQGQPAEIVNFGAVTAQYFRFTVLTDYNGQGFPSYQALVFDSLDPSAPELNPAAATLPFAFMATLLLAGATRRKSLPLG